MENVDFNSKQVVFLGCLCCFLIFSSSALKKVVPIYLNISIEISRLNVIIRGVL